MNAMSKGYAKKEISIDPPFDKTIFEAAFPGIPGRQSFLSSEGKRIQRIQILPEL